MLLSSKQSTVSHYSSIGTLVLFLLTMFQLLKVKLLHTQPFNMQGEHWIKIVNSRLKVFFAHSLGRPVSSNSSTNRWCQKLYKLILAFAIPTRFMQLFIFSGSDWKKSLEFTMLISFYLWVATCNIPFFSM